LGKRPHTGNSWSTTSAISLRQIGLFVDIPDHSLIPFTDPTLRKNVKLHRHMRRFRALLLLA
jgi:hypothetical protein